MLATVIDCYSKKVVGFSMADHIKDTLVIQALDNAATTTVIEPEAMFHSDKGVQYTSKRFREVYHLFKAPPAHQENLALAS